MRRTSTRRRVLLASAAMAGLAGCTGDDGGTSPTATDTGTPTDTGTATDTATATDGHDHGDEEPTGTDDEGPGYKANHWHGRLFFEVNGELVNFRQPKYYLKNIQDDNPDAVYFHFHEDPQNHGPNEWSNEKKIVTLDYALDLLPGISYDRSGGEHAVTYEGTTYDATESGTEISIHRGTETVDPTNYEVAHDDNFWVQIVTDDAQRNVSPAHGGADLGTMIFDVNNLRVDFGEAKYVGEDAGSQAFHFHDDGHDNLWYKEGSVTLAEALNALPDISYERVDGEHILEYGHEDHPEHSRKFDGGRPEHDVIIRQRAEDVDPTSYEPQAGDIVWLYVHSSVVPDNEH